MQVNRMPSSPILTANIGVSRIIAAICDVDNKQISANSLGFGAAYAYDGNNTCLGFGTKLFNHPAADDRALIKDIFKAFALNPAVFLTTANEYDQPEVLMLSGSIAKASKLFWCQLKQKFECFPNCVFSTG